MLQLLLLFLADALEEPSLALQLLDHRLVRLVAPRHLLQVGLQFAGIDILMRGSLRGERRHSVQFPLRIRVVILGLNGGLVHLVHGYQL